MGEMGRIALKQERQQASWRSRHINSRVMFGLVGLSLGLLVGCNPPQPEAAPSPTESPSAIASPSPSDSPSPSPTGTPSPSASPTATKPEAVVAVEQRISTLVGQATNVTIEAVECPAAIAEQAGQTYECQVKSAIGPFVVIVRPTGQPGKFAWGTRGLLLTSKLNTFIQKSVQPQGNVTVDCGTPARIAKQGETFDCKVTTANGKTQTAKITVRDELGNVYVALQ